ncbi:sushi, von Willebrand factor type A, EGF and pentraxin domain-containing protein 1-like isoform X2 [Ostrea edulis]|uniref:sushi, von Willebrand factor type A, EGF and pentraxin domain-containing protein 1-like isoform X2 n=1 Tax=Ostrea edulis TaxID=37623 RepID=UPI0024AEDBC1|nr:sushi, von Willebrand factor type A, EGF and pentraxin domain-containing protein 1-like isoform X2 [Ostrea edulis]
MQINQRHQLHTLGQNPLQVTQNKELSVISCDPIPWPLHGTVNCHSGEFIYGSSCNVQCDLGYEMTPMAMNGSQTITCNANGQTDSAPNTCQVIKCPDNDTNLQAEHGSISCTDENKYNSLCVTQCDSGYGHVTGDGTVCNEDKTWSNKISDCRDVQPPSLKHCPVNIVTYANRNNQSNPVTWTTPSGEDNSGTFYVNQTSGPSSGSKFPVGNTEIRYVAFDLDGNASPECVFFVTVEEIICEPPNIPDSYMTISCPDGYTFGSVCHLGCKSVFPLIGQSNITCERNNTMSPPKGYWDMGGSDPYCQKNPCDPLLAPLNGAIVCDTWLYGRHCQMQCSDKYDIPYGTAGTNGASFTGAFTCTDLRGTYMPSNFVPNCTDRRNPRRTMLPGEFFYYTGDCSDPTVLTEIKDNFIKHMQKEEVSGFGGVCPSHIECNVNNTVVTCGQISGRKKRTVREERGVHVHKRSTHEIRVEISLDTTWYNFNSSNGDTFRFLENLQTKMFDVVKQLGSNGDLTVRGLSPDVNSFQLGFSDASCPDGTALRWNTLTCVPCSVGNYLNNTDPYNPGCYDCPKGTYKDNVDTLKCSQCPTGTSTLKEASTSNDQCIDQCRPGEYSATGLVPCVPCPRSTYQSQTMATSCSPCPSGKTSTPGSTSITDCKDFDVVFKHLGDSINFAPVVTSGETALTITMWIKLANATNNFTLYKAGTASSDIEINYRNKFFIIVNGNEIPSNQTLIFGKWIHVAFVLDSTNQMAHIFVNGSKPFTATIPVTNGISLIDSQSFITVQQNQEDVNGVVLSGYHVLSGVSTESEVAQLATTCHAAIPSLTNITVNVLRGASTAVPSACDGSNQCDPNPCNGHPCVDETNSFVCNCMNGFTGNTCQTKPNFCTGTPCVNSGTCQSNESNFTCICPTGYLGKRCETKIVNGGWSEWTGYTTCSASCNVGTKNRTRECNNPPPGPGGIPCNPQLSSETVSCNSDPCPVCPPLQKGFGSTSNCTTMADGTIACTLSCRPGLMFSASNPPLKEYKCGPNSAYKWNGIPPACGRGYGPQRMVLTTQVSYSQSVPCNQAASVSQSLKNNMQGGLRCALNNICDVQVDILGCSGIGRKRRSTSSEIVITLSVTFTNTDIDLASYQSYENISQPLAELITALQEMEASESQLNSTYSLFTFLADGIPFSSSVVSSSNAIQCENNLGTSGSLCVECPRGTYLSSESCHVCSIGTYQDSAGQTSCKSCPSGYTTHFVASQDSSACSVPSTKSPVTNSGSGDVKSSEDRILLMACVVASLSVVILLTSIISIFIYRHVKRSQFKRTKEQTGSWASRSMVGPNGPPPPYTACTKMK